MDNTFKDIINKEIIAYETIYWGICRDMISIIGKPTKQNYYKARKITHELKNVCLKNITVVPKEISFDKYEDFECWAENCRNFKFPSNFGETRTIPRYDIIVKDNNNQYSSSLTYFIMLNMCNDIFESYNYCIPNGQMKEYIDNELDNICNSLIAKHFFTVDIDYITDICKSVDNFIINTTLYKEMSSIAEGGEMLGGENISESNEDIRDLINYTARKLARIVFQFKQMVIMDYSLPHNLPIQESDNTNNMNNKYIIKSL